MESRWAGRLLRRALLLCKLDRYIDGIASAQFSVVVSKEWIPQEVEVIGVLHILPALFSSAVCVDVPPTVEVAHGGSIKRVVVRLPAWLRKELRQYFAELFDVDWRAASTEPGAEAQHGPRERTPVEAAAPPATQPSSPVDSWAPPLERRFSATGAALASAGSAPPERSVAVEVHGLDLALRTYTSIELAAFSTKVITEGLGKLLADAGGGGGGLPNSTLQSSPRDWGSCLLTQATTPGRETDTDSEQSGLKMRIMEQVHITCVDPVITLVGDSGSGACLTAESVVIDGPMRAPRNRDEECWFGGDVAEVGTFKSALEVRGNGVSLGVGEVAEDGKGINHPTLSLDVPIFVTVGMFARSELLQQAPDKPGSGPSWRFAAPAGARFSVPVGLCAGLRPLCCIINAIVVSIVSCDLCTMASKECVTATDDALAEEFRTLWLRHDACSKARLAMPGVQPFAARFQGCFGPCARPVGPQGTPVPLSEAELDRLRQLTEDLPLQLQALLLVCRSVSEAQTWLRDSPLQVSKALCHSIERIWPSGLMQIAVEVAHVGLSTMLPSCVGATGCRKPCDLHEGGKAPSSPAENGAGNDVHLQLTSPAIAIYVIGLERPRDRRKTVRLCLGGLEVRSSSPGPPASSGGGRALLQCWGSAEAQQRRGSLRGGRPSPGSEVEPSTPAQDQLLAKDFRAMLEEETMPLMFEMDTGSFEEQGGLSGPAPWQLGHIGVGECEALFPQQPSGSPASPHSVGTDIDMMDFHVEDVPPSLSGMPDCFGLRLDHGRQPPRTRFYRIAISSGLDLFAWPGALALFARLGQEFSSTSMEVQADFLNAVCPELHAHGLRFATATIRMCMEDTANTGTLLSARLQKGIRVDMGPLEATTGAAESGQNFRLIVTLPQAGVKCCTSTREVRRVFDLPQPLEVELRCVKNKASLYQSFRFVSSMWRLDVSPQVMAAAAKLVREVRTVMAALPKPPHEKAKDAAPGACGNGGDASACSTTELISVGRRRSTSLDLVRSISGPLVGHSLSMPSAPGATSSSPPSPAPPGLAGRRGASLAMSRSRARTASNASFIRQLTRTVDNDSSNQTAARKVELQVCMGALRLNFCDAIGRTLRMSMKAHTRAQFSLAPPPDGGLGKAGATFCLEHLAGEFASRTAGVWEPFLEPWSARAEFRHSSAGTRLDFSDARGTAATSGPDEEDQPRDVGACPALLNVTAQLLRSVVCLSRELTSAVVDEDQHQQLRLGAASRSTQLKSLRTASSSQPDKARIAALNLSGRNVSLWFQLGSSLGDARSRAISQHWQSTDQSVPMEDPAVMVDHEAFARDGSPAALDHCISEPMSTAMVLQLSQMPQEHLSRCPLSPTSGGTLSWESSVPSRIRGASMSLAQGSSTCSFETFRLSQHTLHVDHTWPRHDQKPILPLRENWCSAISDADRSPSKGRPADPADGCVPGWRLDGLIVQVLMPHPSRRLVLIASPIRVFNYTDKPLYIRVCARRGTHIEWLAFTREFCETSTAPASLLGAVQPLEAAAQQCLQKHEAVGEWVKHLPEVVDPDWREASSNKIWELEEDEPRIPHTPEVRSLGMYASPTRSGGPRSPTFSPVVPKLLGDRRARSRSAATVPATKRSVSELSSDRYSERRFSEINLSPEQEKMAMWPLPPGHFCCVRLPEALRGYDTELGLKLSTQEKVRQRDEWSRTIYPPLPTEGQRGEQQWAFLTERGDGGEQQVYFRVYSELQNYDKPHPVEVLNFLVLPAMTVVNMTPARLRLLVHHRPRHIPTKRTLEAEPLEPGQCCHLYMANSQRCVGLQLRLEDGSATTLIRQGSKQGQVDPATPAPQSGTTSKELGSSESEVGGREGSEQQPFGVSEWSETIQVEAWDSRRRQETIPFPKAFSPPTVEVTNTKYIVTISCPYVLTSHSSLHLCAGRHPVAGVGFRPFPKTADGVVLLDAELPSARLSLLEEAAQIEQPDTPLRDTSGREKLQAVLTEWQLRPSCPLPLPVTSSSSRGRLKGRQCTYEFTVIQEQLPPVLGHLSAPTACFRVVPNVMISNCTSETMLVRQPGLEGSTCSITASKSAPCCAFPVSFPWRPFGKGERIVQIQLVESERAAEVEPRDLWSGHIVCESSANGRHSLRVRRRGRRPGAGQSAAESSSTRSPDWASEEWLQVLSVEVSDVLGGIISVRISDEASIIFSNLAPMLAEVVVEADEPPFVEQEDLGGANGAGHAIAKVRSLTAKVARETATRLRAASLDVASTVRAAGADVASTVQTGFTAVGQVVGFSKDVSVPRPEPSADTNEVGELETLQEEEELDPWLESVGIRSQWGWPTSVGWFQPFLEDGGVKSMSLILRWRLGPRRALWGAAGDARKCLKRAASNNSNSKMDPRAEKLPPNFVRINLSLWHRTPLVVLKAGLAPETAGHRDGPIGVIVCVLPRARKQLEALAKKLPQRTADFDDEDGSSDEAYEASAQKGAWLKASEGSPNFVEVKEVTLGMLEGVNVKWVCGECGADCLACQPFSPRKSGGLPTPRSFEAAEFIGQHIPPPPAQCSHCQSALPGATWVPLNEESPRAPSSPAVRPERSGTRSGTLGALGADGLICVNVSLSRLDISVVSEEKRAELLFGRLEGLRLSLAQGPMHETCSLSLQDFRIDCQPRQARGQHPVSWGRRCMKLLTGKAEYLERTPALVASVGAPQALEGMEEQPSLQLDWRRPIGIVGDDTQLLERLNVLVGQRVEIAVDNEAAIGVLTLQKEMEVASAWAEDCLPHTAVVDPQKAFGEQIQELRRDFVTHFEAPPVPSVMQVEQVVISGMEIVVWVSVGMARLPATLLPVSLTLLWNLLAFSDTLYVEGSMLVLKGWEKTHIRGSAGQLQKIVMLRYQRSLLMFLARMVGSSNLLPCFGTSVAISRQAASLVADMFWQVASAVDESLLAWDAMERRRPSTQSNVEPSSAQDEMGRVERILEGIFGVRDIISRPRVKLRHICCPVGAVLTLLDFLWKQSRRPCRGGSFQCCRRKRAAAEQELKSVLPQEAPGSSQSPDSSKPGDLEGGGSPSPQRSAVARIRGNRQPRLCQVQGMRLPRMLFGEAGFLAPYEPLHAELLEQLGADLTECFHEVRRLAGGIDDAVVLCASRVHLLLVNLGHRKAHGHQAKSEKPPGRITFRPLSPTSSPADPALATHGMRTRVLGHGATSSPTPRANPQLLFQRTKLHRLLQRRGRGEETPLPERTSGWQVLHWTWAELRNVGLRQPNAQGDDWVLLVETTGGVFEWKLPVVPVEDGNAVRWINQAIDAHHSC